MTQDATTELWSYLYPLIGFAIWAVIATPIAWKRGWFSYSDSKGAMGEASPIGIGRLVGVAAVYVGVAVLCSFLAWAAIDRGIIPRMAGALPSIKWLMLLIPLIAMVCTLLYSAACGRVTWRWLWKPHPFQAIISGFCALFVTIPLTYFLGTVLQMALFAIWGPTDEKQVALNQLIQMKAYPGAFTFMLLTVIFIVPVTEEVLFRGFVQGWFRRHFSRQPALWLSALVFGFAHFSLAQGASNFHLLPPLILFGWFLGHVFEKYRTLWASIGMHALFNAISAILVLFGVE